MPSKLTILFAQIYRGILSLKIQKNEFNSVRRRCERKRKMTFDPHCADQLLAMRLAGITDLVILLRSFNATDV